MNLPGQPVALPQLGHPLQLQGVISQLLIGVVELLVQPPDADIFRLLPGEQQDHIEDEQQDVEGDQHALHSGEPAADGLAVVVEIGAEWNLAGGGKDNFVLPKGVQENQRHHKAQPVDAVAHIMNQIGQHQQRHAAVVKVQRDRDSDAEHDLHHAEKQPGLQPVNLPPGFSKADGAQQQILAQSPDRHLPGVSGYPLDGGQKFIGPEGVTDTKGSRQADDGVVEDHHQVQQEHQRGEIG